MDNTYSVLGTSLYSRKLLEDDNSWNDLKWDWSTLSFEEEMHNRASSQPDFFEKISQPLVLPNNVAYSKAEKKMGRLLTQCNDVMVEYNNHLNQVQQLKTTHKELTKFSEKMASKIEKLEDSKNLLETEITETASELKQHKLAYKIALQTYRERFDFSVSVLETSELLLIADIRFNFAKNKPIKVVIDRSKRKVIEIDTAGLEFNGALEDANFNPGIFCDLRKKMLENM